MITIARAIGHTASFLAVSTALFLMCGSKPPVQTIPCSGTCRGPLPFEVEPEAIPEPEPEPAPVVPPPPVPRRILIVGDSEACTVAPYVGVVKLPTDTVETDCKGGTVVEYWAENGAFRAALARHKQPDVVLVFLGTNNYWNKKSPDAGPLLKIVKERGIQCVWVGNTATHGGRWPVNGWLKEQTESTCVYFDTEAADIPLWDGTHPNKAASIEWLKKVWPVIPFPAEPLILAPR